MNTLLAEFPGYAYIALLVLGLSNGLMLAWVLARSRPIQSASCGACGHGLHDSAGEVCTECGARFKDGGIMVDQLRRGLPGWLLLLCGLGIGFAILLPGSALAQKTLDEEIPVSVWEYIKGDYLVLDPDVYGANSEYEVFAGEWVIGNHDRRYYRWIQKPNALILSVRQGGMVTQRGERFLFSPEDLGATVDVDSVSQWLVDSGLPNDTEAQKDRLEALSAALVNNIRVGITGEGAYDVGGEGNVMGAKSMAGAVMYRVEWLERTLHLVFSLLSVGLLMLVAAWGFLRWTRLRKAGSAHAG